MQIAIFKTESGAVVIGVISPLGLVPVLTFLTWAEYIAFLEHQTKFVEYVYQHSMRKQGAAERYINSLEKLDAI